MEIRRAEDADLEAVVEIQKAITQKGVPSDWINRVNLYLGRPESICLVAVRDNDVIGYFFGKIMYGAFGLERSGWIELFGVSPKAMGQGVGRALAGAVFEQFKEAGIEDVYTAVQWDSGDLLAFFKKIGFNLSNSINLKKRLD